LPSLLNQKVKSTDLWRLLGVEEMTIETVMVTGSSGFIGFPVARALAETGRQVVGLDPVSPVQELSGVTTVQEVLGDVRQMSELLRARKIEVVIHAGGISGPMLAQDDPYAICTANVIGTVNLIEAARREGVRRFVYCSSAAAFGDTPPAPVPDDAPLQPINLYGATKGAGDLILAAYRAKHGLEGISLKLSSVYGPADGLRYSDDVVERASGASRAFRLGDRVPPALSVRVGRRRRHPLCDRSDIDGAVHL